MERIAQITRNTNETTDKHDLKPGRQRERPISIQASAFLTIC